MRGDSRLAAEIRDALENTPRDFPSSATVACQGREGAYSSIACDKLFQRPSIMYFNTFEGVFQAVEKGFCRYGICLLYTSTETVELPQENPYYNETVYFAECILKGEAPDRATARQAADTVRIALAEMRSADGHGALTDV